MSDFTQNSTHLDLPYIQPSQAQKHVTHNEALRRLDALVQLSVSSATQAAPPAAPQEGARYILPAGASGAWSGQAEGALALREGGAWVFLAPQPGWRAFVADTGAFRLHDGTGWRDAGGDHQNLPLIGVATTADSANRLAVASEAVLLTHAGAGHQLKVNKAAAADTASLLFQTGWSGRAEMGTTGSDDFEIKVSDDGAAFHGALRAEAASGRVTLPGNAARWDGPYCTGDRRARITVSATWGMANAAGGNLQRLVDGTMGQHVYSDGSDQSGKHIQLALAEARQVTGFRLHFSTPHTGDVKTVIRATDDPASEWLTVSGPVAWSDMMEAGVVTLPAFPMQGFTHYRIHALSGAASAAPWFHGIEMVTQG
ncbi:DUF2793 domain-containing protein [Roseovarius spongiae]|uniref:DUF2793 domain-containing protein n=1 Tax=Roseovarius spongiae TaxID=2320272 RepID=A0A3A8AQ85_9RHOB|nr:DUF2793 domain-containing protein [Roseovarius spongiae]RKF12432.1 DUF2793 domain-containing protein [Roseovarius spongiae]